MDRFTLQQEQALKPKSGDPAIDGLIYLAERASSEAAEKFGYGLSSGVKGRSWRDAANVVLSAADSVIPAGTPSKVRKKVYSELYCFGERAMHPYKIWCSEVHEFMAKHYPDEYQSKKTPRAKRMAEQVTGVEQVLSFAF